MGRLSGGLKQRAAIAATIIGSPPVLIFDEPTVGLDPEQRIFFREVLQELREHTIILSTHLIEDVVASADRGVVFADGRALFDGSTEQLRQRSSHEGSTDAVRHLEDGFLSVIGRLHR